MTQLDHSHYGPTPSDTTTTGPSVGVGGYFPYPHPSSSSSPPPLPNTYANYAHPPPPQGPTTQYGDTNTATSPSSDGGYTTTSSGGGGGIIPHYPIPGASPMLFGRGPSPGPSVPPSEMGSGSGGSRSGSVSGHGGAGYPAFGTAAGRMTKGGGGGDGGGRLTVSNLNEGENTNGFYQSRSSPTSPPPIQRGEKSETNLPRGTGGGVIVHQDGGRIPQLPLGDEVDEGEREIPPTYESIPIGERR